MEQAWRTVENREPEDHVDALYLFACRLGWLVFGEEAFYTELLCAASHPDPDVRLVANTFLAELVPTRLREGREAICQS